MANKSFFNFGKQDKSPSTALNAAQAPAYDLGPKGILAQLVSTGTISDSFYSKANDQFKMFLDNANQVEPIYLAKLAIYSRNNARMKDMPALLCVILSIRDQSLFKTIFPIVIDNPRMLRTFVQIIRSGHVGRKSLGSLPKRMIHEWLDARSDESLFKGSVGNDPSLKDVICLVHPKPKSQSRDALYENLVDKKDSKKSDLIQPVKDLERFRSGELKSVPAGVPFLMLTSSQLGQEQWTAIARAASWTELRMNLNTFERHGVFAGENSAELIETLAQKLENRNEIMNAKALPYQLLAAYESSLKKVPERLSQALARATEIALENVPAFDEKLHIMIDVSGSMLGAAVTGVGSMKPSSVMAIDAAALIGAAVIKKNPGASAMAFDTAVVQFPLGLDRSNIFALATVLKMYRGGGTDCSAPLKRLNLEKAKGDLLIMVSDNESWFNANGFGRSTAVVNEWNCYKKRNPQARLICIDLCPNATSQVNGDASVLNVGGFSDDVFNIIKKFLGSKGEHDFVAEIEAIQIVK